MAPFAEFIKGIRGTDFITTGDFPQVAFVGRSNVGKSSLIASIMQNRSLVKISNKPGKTSEINFFLVNKKSYLVDLPGYGYAKADAKEREKLRKLIIWYLTDPTIKLARVVLVIDVKVGITPFDLEMISVLRERRHPFVIVANKTDKLGQKELAFQLKAIKQESLGVEVIPTSAIKMDLSGELFNKFFE